MSKILLYLCCSCCPCFKSSDKNKNKTKDKMKTKPKVNEKKTAIDSKDWENKTDLLTPSKIADKDLTKTYRIPEDYPTEEECLKAQDLEVMAPIATGAFGAVSKAYDKSVGTERALKRISLSSDSMSDQMVFENLKSELFVLVKVKRNENIVQVFRHFIVSHSIRKTEFCYIVMEYANGGTVLNKMRANDGKEKRLPEPKAKDFFRQITRGLYALHSSKIAHKDLKLDNVLVFIRDDGTECLKITDFGLSRIRYNETEGIVIKDKGIVGSLAYMSPQILKIYIYDLFGERVGKLKTYDPFVADCWALGVCLYVMVLAKQPFLPKSEKYTLYAENYQKMISRNLEIPANFHYNYSTLCLDMIRQLLEPDVTKRLNIQTVLRHRWLIDSN